jgi:hypothetical protein
MMEDDFLNHEVVIGMTKEDIDLVESLDCQTNAEREAINRVCDMARDMLLLRDVYSGMLKGYFKDETNKKYDVFCITAATLAQRWIKE